MKRRDFLAALGAGSLAAMTTAAVRGAQAKRPPNLIIIFADDQGYNDLGCFGSPDIKTPCIDRMAKEGMKFTDFYVASPLCSPSRAALMTGCYPRRVGLAKWVLRPDSKRGLHPNEITIAELLRKRGYTCACIGKWHLGFLSPFRPARKGFDYYYGLYHNMDKPEAAHFIEQGGVPLRRNEEVIEWLGSPDSLTERYTEEALRFIVASKDGPFFLYLAHTMPHVPLGVTDRFKGKSAAGLYGDVIECLDWSTGEILGILKKLGLDSSTIVVYTSDNGPGGRGNGSAAPLRGRKNTTFEGGMREPCVMWGPGRIPAGKVCSDLATTMDLCPTFAKLAGAAPPADRVIDGKDIWPLMSGAAGAKSPHEAFFYHSGMGELQAVRSGKWKLHLPTDKRMQPWLFDLAADISESKNVAVDHPEVVDRLKNLAEQFDAELEKNARPAGEGNDKNEGG